MKLSNALIKKCDDDKQKEELKIIIANAKVFTDIVKELLNEKIEYIRKERESSASYASAAWPYAQAHSNGEVKGLKFLLDILP